MNTLYKNMLLPSKESSAGKEYVEDVSSIANNTKTTDLSKRICETYIEDQGAYDRLCKVQLSEMAIYLKKKNPLAFRTQ